MPRRGRLLGIAACAALLAACSSGVHSGRITSKHYERPYVVTQCAGFNSKGICTFYTPIQYPARWVFNLVNNGQDGYMDVDETTYAKFNVGDYYGESS